MLQYQIEANYMEYRKKVDANLAWNISKQVIVY
jgi:hypothetical protein